MQPARHLLVSTACLVIATVSLAACAGSSDSSSSGSPATTTGAAAASTTAAPAAASDAFCTTAVVEYNAALKTITSTSEPPTPEAFKVMIEEAARTNQQLADQAPDEINADVQEVVDATDGYYQALADVGYDVGQMTSDTVTKAQRAVEAPAVAAAAARVTTYVKDTCGVDLTVPGSGAS